LPEDPQTAWLELDESEGPRRFPLRPDRPCRIGRSETGNVVLVDDLVSRNHAIVQCLDAGSFALVDLGSINGTYIEGRRVSVPTVLKDGDRVTIGRSDLRFHQQAPAIPADLVIPVPELEATNVFYSEKLITVLVIDIRDYTGLAQRIDADTLSQIVGSIFREAGKALQTAGAWAQKYIGDAVMAVWIHENRGVDPGTEIAAIVRTLLIIVDLVSQLQQRFGLAAPVRIGAGLNSGPASVGNVGSIAASDYTAVGDVVNKAFRLESATKEVHCDLLMGEETRNLLAGQPDLLRVLNEFSLRLKGYDQAATAWGTDFGKLPPQPPITAAE